MTRRWSARLVLALGGLCLGLLLLEGAIRICGSWLLEYDGGPDHLYFNFPELLPAEHQGSNPCLVLHDGPAPAGRPKILFLGDSVTQRGKLIGALQQHYQEDHYEWLNAGIAGYNTVQEVNLYKNSCRRIRANHVVLTMHNNDFQHNQVMYQRPFSQKQEVVDLQAMGPLRRFLLYNSYIYRLLQGRPGVVGIDPESPGDWQRARQRVARSLTQLRDLSRADGGRLTVVLLPSLRPRWMPAHERVSHETALELLKELKIRHFDLKVELTRAMGDRIKLHEAPGDFLHPSQELANRFGEYLYKQGLL